MTCAADRLAIGWEKKEEKSFPYGVSGFFLFHLDKFDDLGEVHRKLWWGVTMTFLYLCG